MNLARNIFNLERFAIDIFPNTVSMDRCKCDFCFLVHFVFQIILVPGQQVNKLYINYIAFRFVAWPCGQRREYICDDVCKSENYHGQYGTIDFLG